VFTAIASSQKKYDGQRRRLVVARTGRRPRGPIRRAFDRPSACRFHDGGDMRRGCRRRQTPATPSAAATAARTSH